MEFRVLGPLEIVASGEALPLGGAKQQAVIAMLLLLAPEPVAPDRLIDELWGERPPASAAHAVQVYVSAFRKLMRGVGGAGALQIFPSGYRLEVEPESIDARRVARLLDDGRHELASDPRRARLLLDEAAGLWRGPPLAGLTQFDFARREQARLEELHARTLECLVEARLALGEHADVISTLTRLVEADPMREGPRRLLMLGLYRSGRHAEALAVYRDACAALDQVGLRPGPELRDLEASILRHDQSLHLAQQPDGQNKGRGVGADPAGSRLESVRDGRSRDAGGESSPPVAGSTSGARRKVITALCCEVTASLLDTLELDPEALVELTGQYVDDITTIVERNGGQVTRLLGAGAVAVFGLPRVREDDALAAVRAAAEIRAHFASLAEEAGVQLGLRSAVNTGLVVVDPSGGVVLGDAISVGGSLEQAAQAGEILLSSETYRLVKEAVEVEPLQVPSSRGQRMRAYRLLAVEPPAWMPSLRAAMPFVGRQRELAYLRAAWVRCLDGGDCHLFTLLGPAGIGKSRLVEELVGSLGDGSRVLSGRCLHYGDGITFWPIVEALTALGTQADATLERISVGAATSPQELFWEVQQVLEAAARERPVILHIDDLQWAEPMLLELLDHLADYSRGVPILVLCVARPELLEERPQWGGGKANATSVMLEGLETSSCERLLEHTGVELSAEDRSRVAAAGGGNPLFLQELAAVAAEQGTRAVPPTIHALLAARLDGLDSGERELLERAAIEGEIFHVSAVCELADSGEIGDVREQLARLVHKQLIVTHAASLGGGDAFRFRHILIRDAAYEGIGKAARVRLHQRFAGWLKLEAHGFSEFDELTGWHLEQAVRYLQELCRPVDGGLKHAAAVHLHVAGVRAAQRADTIAARKLLDRAWSLTAEGDRLSPWIAVDLADVLMEGGDLQRVDSLLKVAEADPQTSAHAGLVRLHWLTIVRLDEAIETIEAVLPETLIRLQEAGDETGLAKAHLLGYWASSQAAHLVPSAQHAALAAEHARRAGDDGLRSKALALYIVAILHGSMDAPGLRDELDKIEVEEPGPYLALLIQLGRAEVQRLLGDHEGARPGFRDAIEGFRAMGIDTIAAGGQDFYAWTELAGGEPRFALPGLVAIDADLAAAGDRAFRSTVQATLAQVYEHLGELDKARAAVDLAEELTAPRDLLAVALLSISRARLALHDSDWGAAEQWAKCALDVALETEMPFLQGTARIEHARVAALCGRPLDARAEGLEALKAFQETGDQPRASWAMAFLNKIDDSSTAAPR